MGDIKTSVVVDLRGNLEARARRYSRALATMSVKGERSLKRLSSSMVRHGKVLGRFANRYSALIGVGAATAASKSVLTLDERTSRLGVQGGLDDNAVQALKKKMFAVAAQPDVRVDPKELLSAIEEIVAKTGDMKLATENMRNIGLAIQATGAAGQDIGAMVADMQQKFGLHNAKDFLDTLDALVLQGKAGSFELKDLATQGERVTAAYAATGRQGPNALREMGAILQMVKRGTGSADEATTAYERLLSTLTQEKTKVLQKNGIQIWDKDALAKGKKVARSIPDIIKDVIRKTHGDVEKLSKVFDIRSLRALVPFAIEYQRTGGFKSFDEFLAIKGTGKQISADSKRMASSGNASIDNLGGTLLKKLDENIRVPLRDTADAVNQLLDPAKKPARQGGVSDSISPFMRKWNEDKNKGWRGKLLIEVQGGAARVKGVESSDSSMGVDVDSGKMMVSP